MTRIIGGNAGGRRITAPSGQHTRPTTDRVREALFSSIEAWCGSLQGLRFLDLYAGSGAVGLEAWSRGAGVVTLVESDRRTARLIGENAKVLGFAKADVVAGPVTATLSRPPGAPYDVAFLDPPYPLDEAAVGGDLALLAQLRWLVPGAMVVVERSSRSPEPTWPDGIDGQRSKRYGETTLWYGHAAANPEVADREGE
jgi:16S rRNA (guanine966-N2)-methyltransferase